MSTDRNPFEAFSALSFDCYGTLIDWETGIGTALAKWAAGRSVDATADELIEALSRHESVVQTEQPTMLYPEVLAETLRRIAKEFSSEASSAECAEFGASVGDWPAFADSAAALQRLKQRYKLIILSNVDRRSFAASNARLGVEFDLIVTAEDVGAYKPSAISFPTLLSCIGAIDVASTQLLHVAQSIFHDHKPAGKVGLPSVWIDRRSDRQGSGATPAVAGEVKPTWTFHSLAAFADAALGPLVDG